jgi:hypothetical protein
MPAHGPLVAPVIKRASCPLKQTGEDTGTARVKTLLSIASEHSFLGFDYNVQIGVVAR